MAHTEALLELAAFSALGALDGSDREAFEKHLLEGCAECEAAREAWERDISVLSFSVPGVEPARELRARVLEGRVPDRAPAAAAGPSRAMGWLALAASILLAAVALDDLAQRRFVRDERRRTVSLSAELDRTREEVARRELRVRFVEDPEIQTILLSGLAPQPDSRGKILFSPRARRAILLAASLPPLPAGRQYELWFIAGGKPIAAGVFDARPGNATVFESTPLPEGSSRVEKFAVTVEPRGGVPQPTGPMVLIGPA